MKLKLLLLPLLPLAITGCCSCIRAAHEPAPTATEPPGAYKLLLDDLKGGELPKGWKADATNPRGALAEWMVEPDGKAAGKRNVLSIVRITDTSSGHFNLLWTKDIQMKDGRLAVKIRANSGEKDQGGGLIWRVADANNYYLARYNPLENNFRLYYVKGGRRTQLADASGVNIKSGEWFVLAIVVNGDRMEGFLNGKKLLDVTDQTFPDAGGVGFWSKADAASSFDDFVAEPAREGPANK